MRQGIAVSSLVPPPAHTHRRPGPLMSHGMTFAQVAFALPLFHTFTYRVPEEFVGRVKPGSQVQAPFRGRSRRGVVIELSPESPLEKVHELADVLGDRAISPHLLAL